MIYLAGEQVSINIHQKEILIAVLTGLLAGRFPRQASKPADAQTGLADTMDALASKPGEGRNARMKTDDSVGRFVGVHHQVKFSHSIP